jgi:hypothetical protein
VQLGSESVPLRAIADNGRRLLAIAIRACDLWLTFAIAGHVEHARELHQLATLAGHCRQLPAAIQWWSVRRGTPPARAAWAIVTRSGSLAIAKIVAGNCWPGIGLHRRRAARGFADARPQSLAQF